MPRGYYLDPMIDARADQRVLVDMIQDSFPALSQHFANHTVDISLITFQWFFALFVGCVDTPLCIRIWDLLLLHGRVVLFRITLALLQIHSDKLLKITSRNRLFDFLRVMGRMEVDIDQVCRIAMELVRMFTVLLSRDVHINVFYLFIFRLFAIPVDATSHAPYAAARHAQRYNKNTHHLITSSMLMLIHNANANALSLSLFNILIAVV
eukprot:m.183987 g.183987  ORF g.183987 m.183987 type:complete len:209 (-) comp14708_c0_seq1:54-680(-)